jgi:hypothetical protein
MKSFRNRFGHAAAALSLVTLAVEPRASAQVEDPATSRALFDEGRRLAASGKYELACPKFEAARKLYTSAGVLLNLADCYDKIGRTASAWTTFGEAASVASRVQRPDDAVEARRRQAVLEPGLVHVSIRVPHEVAGFTLTLDDLEVPPAAWNEPVPVDPAAHELRAQAPGCRPWTMSVSVSAQDGNRTIDVPELVSIQFLQPAAVIEAKPTSAETGAIGPPAARSNGNGQRVAGFLVGGAGGATLAVGAILGLVAKAQDSAAELETGKSRHPDSVSAVNLGNVATVVSAVGGVVIAAGAVIWLTAPTGPQVGTNGRELLLQSIF